MEDDEIVETSDTEEREALQLQRVADNYLAHKPVAPSLSTRPYLSPAVYDRPSPRKRPKLSHDLPGFRTSHVVQSSSSPSPGANQSDGTIYSPFSPTIPSAMPSSPSTSDPLVDHSPKSNSLAATPGLELSDDERNDNHSQDPLDMFGNFSQQIQVSPFAFGQNEEMEVSDHESITSATQDPLRLRSQPMDPLHLLSSPSPSSKSRNTSSVMDNSPTRQSRTKESDQFPSFRSPSNARHSSLTPPPSQRTVRSSSPIQIAPSSLSPHLHQQPHHRDEEIARELADDSRRYSMRERRPQQLNPYVYDKMLYKRQMKSNPDAIVKFASPRRRNDSRGAAENGEDRDVDQAETQDWALGMDLDDEEDESWVERRRRRRSRSKNGEADADTGDAGLYPELESSDDNQPEMKKLLREAKKAKERALTREREEAKERARREKVEREAEKRRRSKPFPVDKEQARARAKRAEEPDNEDISAGERRSQSPVSSLFEDIRQRPDVPTSSRTTAPAKSPTKSPAISIESSPMRWGSPVGNDDPVHYDFGDAYEGDMGDMEGGMDYPINSPRHSQGMIDASPQRGVSRLGSPENGHLKVPQAPDYTVSQSDSSSGSDSEGLTAKDRKRLKVAQKMIPTFMMQKDMKEAQRRPKLARRQRPTIADSDSDKESEPLVPGKTRIRFGVHGRNTVIKGDTDSSDSERATPAPDAENPDQESDLDRPSQPNYALGNHQPKDDSSSIINISDDESSGSDDEVDDAELEAWFDGTAGHRSTHAKPGHSGRLRDQSLVDYMLTKTRTVGGVRRPRQRQKKTHRPPGAVRVARESMHIVTGGAQKERQTLLSFHKQPKARARGKGIARSSKKSSYPSGMNDDEEPDDLEPNHHWVDARDAAVTTVTKSKKSRKGQRSGHIPGLHVFTSKDRRIISGRQINNTITINADDEDLFHALAPSTEGNRRSSPQHRESPPRRQPRLTAFEGFGDDPAPIHNSMDVDSDVPHPRRDHRASNDWRRIVNPDFDIPFLQSGIVFSAQSYVGRGLLNELICVVSGNDTIAVPGAYAALGFEFGSDTSATELSTSLVTLVDSLLNFVLGEAGGLSKENMRHWEGLMRVITQLLSWLPNKSSAEDSTTLGSVLEDQLLRLITGIEDKLSPPNGDEAQSSIMILAVHWFAIESLVRYFCGLHKDHPGILTDSKNLLKYITHLARRLREHGVQQMMGAIISSSDPLDTSLVPLKTAELWVCVFHLVDNCGVISADEQKHPHVHPFWSIVQLSLNHMDHGGLEASEDIWRMIFSLSALSQFSPHGMTMSSIRLPESWELVVFALKQIRLKAERDNDATLTERALRLRDDYIRIISSRCFILHTRWHWPLASASLMFNQLADIFRSRNFANLQKEPADFPTFLLNNDLQQLSQYHPSDTAFELFLKLIVQASKEDSKTDNAVARKNLSATTKKLLSLAIPVGSVPFTKSTPPTKHELSMLYNRFSAIAVAIYLESSVSSVKSRIGQARRYFNFRDADSATRIAGVRSVMLQAIILQNQGLPLEEALHWLSEMTGIVVDEYLVLDGKTAHLDNGTRTQLLLVIQMLLGCVRRIIEAASRNAALQDKPLYPDPALLQGPWVTRIFSTSSPLLHVGGTGEEIRKLVQAFLDARQAALPRTRQLSTTIPRNNEDSQESQEDYGAFDLDLDDPELQAALGNEQENQHSQVIKIKEDAVCQVIDKHITPAIYRLVTRWLNDVDTKQTFEEYCHTADKWIDCWVGCASISVQNGKKHWNSFLELGGYSWERIIDPSWRRRVGLRFMFMLLRSDPEAYAKHTDRFMTILLESMVSKRLTLENEYVALVFSIDQLRHPLLRHVPCEAKPGSSDFVISVAEFKTLRLPIINSVFSDLTESLRSNRHENRNQQYIRYIASMFSTMEDIYQDMNEQSQERVTYSAFCREVFDLLHRHDELALQSRLASFVKWGQTLAPV